VAAKDILAKKGMEKRAVRGRMIDRRASNKFDRMRELYIQLEVRWLETEAEIALKIGGKRLNWRMSKEWSWTMLEHIGNTSGG